MLSILFIVLFTPTDPVKSIPTPTGYKRIQTSSFGHYLRNIRLKKDKTVYLYNGQKKFNQNAQYAVLDISVGKKNLQQCADAVMRLRAEWLFATKQYHKIIFTSVGKKKMVFQPPFTYPNFLRHMEAVFSLCNSWSLEQELKPKNIQDIEIGDVLIKGGFPGHVVIVVDMAINANGNKAYMLAQSYMPAQDIHILKGQDGPWYFVKEGEIDTPEYRFTSNQLRTW